MNSKRDHSKIDGEIDQQSNLPLDDGAGGIGIPGNLGAHDVGGIDTLMSKQVDIVEKPITFWEQKVHASVVILISKNLLSIDELRRSVESLDHKDYKEWGYYARWALCMTIVLVEKGAVSQEEFNTALGIIDRIVDTEPRLKAGTYVKVCPEDKYRHARKPHLRTPGYIFGAQGLVVSYEGLFADPTLAVIGVRAKQHLYKVSFQQSDVWGQSEQGNDTIEVDIYEPWLQRIDTPPPEKHQHPEPHSSPTKKHSGHDHSHEHEGHVHLSRLETEQKALDLEGPESHGEKVSEAVLGLLLDKGLIDLASMLKGIDDIECASTQMAGARLVARAWVDPSFQTRLLDDASSAAAELGICATNSTSHTKLKVVQSTERVHNLVVCTLCSCYPISLLGLPPAWYKGRCYRARAVREPRAMLEDSFGLKLPSQVAVKVHDSTADIRYLVLPVRPSGSEEWSEEKLLSCITRNSMIGVEVLGPV